MKSTKVLVFVLGLSSNIIALFISGCGKATEEDKSSPVHNVSKEKDDHTPNAKTVEKENFNPKELLEQTCEHEIKTYLCDECRYEIGIVKAEKRLFEPDPKTGKSFLSKIKTEKRKISTLISVTGEVGLNENRTRHVSSRAEGIIKSLEVDIGSIVKEGGVLFTIDSIEIGVAVNEYFNYKSILVLESRNLERIRTLYEKKIVSEGDFIESRIKYEESLTALRTAKNKIEIYGLTAGDIDGINPESDGQAISILPIKSTINGTVIARHAVSGEHLNPKDDIMPVMTVSDLDTLWVLADVYESDLKALLDANSEKAECEIETLSFKGKIFMGTIENIGMTIDEATRTVKVRLAVGNPDGILRPGMFCSVKIPVSPSEEMTAVPESALLSDEGKSFVFVEIIENFFVRKPVKTGRKSGGYVEITEGLKLDEQVVSVGSFLLKSDVLKEKMGAGCAD
jgi:cobalt-zinc-cadmium efflux system membrane fusion protein